VLRINIIILKMEGKLGNKAGELVDYGNICIELTEKCKKEKEDP